MSHYLYLLRHAKSDLNDALRDVDRPLNPCGIKSVEILGAWLKAEQDYPERIYSSPACRAEQTIRKLCQYMPYAESDIHWKPDLYLAGLNDLLSLVAQCPQECNRLMIVGHNPGLESLLAYLLSDDNSFRLDKRLTTAAIAKLAMPQWQDIRPACAKLVYLRKPRDT